MLASVLWPQRAGMLAIQHSLLVATQVANLKQQEVRSMSLFGSEISHNGIHAAIFRALLKEGMLCHNSQASLVCIVGILTRLVCGLELYDKVAALPFSLFDMLQLSDTAYLALLEFSLSPLSGLEFMYAYGGMSHYVGI